MMAEKKTLKGKPAAKPAKMSSDVRRVRTMNIIFLIITAILILSMILAAVSKY
jgi:hypothetical protein